MDLYSGTAILFTSDIVPDRVILTERQLQQKTIVLMETFRDREAVGFATTLVLGCQPRAKFPVYLWFVATFVTGFFTGAIFRFAAAAFLTDFELIWLDHGGTDSDDCEETQFR